MAAAGGGGLSAAPPLSRPLAPPPGAATSNQRPSRPLPPPPPEHREDPRPATDPVLRNGGRCSVDRGEPGEGSEVPPSPVPFSPRLPSPSRSPRRLDEPSYPCSSQRRFLSRSAQPAKLPVADPVPGRGLRRLGRGGTSACLSPFTPAGGPLLLEVGKRGGTGRAAGELPALTARRRGVGAGRRVGAPRGCVGSDYEVPTPLPRERKRDAQTPPLHN